MMNYKLLADLTAIIHFITITSLVIGLLVSFRYKRFRPLEAGVLISIILLWSYYGNCPLTIVEQYFRDWAGENANLTSVGFLPYYANKFFGYTLASRTVQKSVFFTGGALFSASIEWLAPFMHLEIFRVKRALRRLARN